MDLKTKRPRIVVLKPSKGACRTCRIRRVKCDQERPRCRKCTSTGRSCDGYQPGSSAVRRDETHSSRQILPSPVFETSPLQIDSAVLPARSFNLSNYERNAFDFFLRETVALIWQFSPAREWVQIALQVSVEQPTVFYAIATVGGAHRGQVPIVHHTHQRLIPATDQDGILRQHCKTTAAVQKYIDDTASRQASIEPVLLCCILFACFEMCQDQSELSMAHLRLGRRVASGTIGPARSNGANQSYRLSQRLKKPPDILVWAIEKFEGDSICLGPGRLARPDDQPHYSLSSRYDLLISHIASIEQAKETLDSVVSDASRLREELLHRAENHIMRTDHSTQRQAVRYCMAHSMSRSIEIDPKDKILNRRDELLRAHSTWLNSFQAMELEDASGVQASMSMQIQQFFSAFTLATCRETRELSTDAFEDEFSRVLRLAEQYIGCPLDSTYHTGPKANHCKDCIAGSSLKSTQSMAYELLPAIYLICLKSRVTATRRRGISLLRRADRKEGFYWSRAEAVYAECIGGLEEERGRSMLGELVDADQLPEAARFLDVVSEGIAPEEVKLLCGRYRHESDGRLEVIEYRGVWTEPLVLPNCPPMPMITLAGVTVF